MVERKRGRAYDICIYYCYPTWVKGNRELKQFIQFRKTFRTKIPFNHRQKLKIKILEDGSILLTPYVSWKDKMKR